MLRSKTEKEHNPGDEESNQTLDLFNKVEAYIENNTAKKYSAEEYFLMLLKKGLETRKEGNYGIAACLVTRDKGKEVIIFGKNKVFSENDPHAHAEMNTIKNARKIISGNKKFIQSLANVGDIIYRKAPHSKKERFLVTTLEPCPMCTVGSVINSDVKTVLIGTQDEYAGACESHRLTNLAPLWKQIADSQNLNVIFAQNKRKSNKISYLSPELQALLNDLFFETKERLDKKLEQEGFIDLSSIGLIVNGILNI